LPPPTEKQMRYRACVFERPFLIHNSPPGPALGIR
jgi:hypothetical protein